MNQPLQNVIVRFPPSPTGFCHVGTARMAIVNYLFAKHNNGKIIFRSEDTDKERSTKEYEDDILESLSWLGLAWDEFYRQSERTAIYTDHIEKLIKEDKAYISKEPSKKEEGKEVDVVRLRNPGKVITFNDIIRGDITFDTTELGDFAIARAIDDPLYHLTVVIDDALMGVTHVIRGEEHISNTPRQILIQEALGFKRPAYAHYPLHLGADKSKLSKRKGDVSVKSYREKGYLAEALRNYIALLGWTPPSEKEIMTLEEMIAEFELSDLHKSGAVFDIEKLNWYNRQYLLEMREDDFADQALQILKEGIETHGFVWNENSAHKILPIIRERTTLWQELKTMITEGEFDFFFADPTLDVAKIPGKGSDTQTSKQHLEKIYSFMKESRVEDFNDAESIKSMVWDYATEHGRGFVLWPLRYVLSGKEKSPDPFTIASIIGKDATLHRITSALALL